jgi:glycosyltransferase involved in cell wall biosynthesis
MVTVYTLAYNEELFLPFMVHHYRERFPNCRIVVHDNMSTDNTVTIAEKNHCEVIPYDTQNQLQDLRMLEIKNNCWKSASTDWVLVCDMDELLDIHTQQLTTESDNGATIIQSETYDMINMQNTNAISEIKYAVPSPLPGKALLFNKRYISDINYDPGCHSCSPDGKVVCSQEAYKLYHYASLGEDITIKRFVERAVRLSQENLQNRWGFHYLMTPQEIQEEYATERIKAIKVRD